MTLRDLENEGITINDAVSRRMKELAYLHDLKFSEIIRRGNLNQTTISEIIQTRSKHPRISTILKFCNGCGITLEEFFTSEFFRNNITEEEKDLILSRKNTAESELVESEKPSNEITQESLEPKEQ